MHGKYGKHGKLMTLYYKMVNAKAPKWMMGRMGTVIIIGSFVTFWMVIFSILDLLGWT